MKAARKLTAMPKPLPWQNDSRASRAEWRHLLAESRKGPQINPPPSERDRRETTGWEAQQLHKGLSTRRARRRFCCLPLDRLRGLPKVCMDTEGGGVYFLWCGPQLIYVGKAVELSARVWKHYRDGRKMFTHATYLAGPDDLIRSFEAEFVRAYRPPLNLTSTG